MREQPEGRDDRRGVPEADIRGATDFSLMSGRSRIRILDKLAGERVPDRN